MTKELMKLLDAYDEAEELSWVNKDAPAQARAKLVDAIESLQAESERLKDESISYKIAWERICDAAKDIATERDALAAKLVLLTKAWQTQAERLVEIAQELKNPRMPLQTVVNVSVRYLAEAASDALHHAKAIDAAKGGQHEDA